MRIAPSPRKGRLIQNIQRHETFSAKPPPAVLLALSRVLPNRSPLTKKRARDCSNRPHSTEEAEPLSSLTQGNSVDNHHLSQTDDSTSTNTLNGTTNQDNSEVVCHSSHNTTSQEESQADVDQRLATKDMAEGPDDGLEHCRCEEERGSAPERLDGGTTELSRYHLESC